MRQLSWVHFCRFVYFYGYNFLSTRRKSRFGFYAQRSKKNSLLCQSER